MGSWANKREAKLWSTITRRVRSRYTREVAAPAQGLFNLRCFDNSVQWAKSRPRYGVAEVIYIADETPILHYLNTKDGELFETTLGWRATNLEYYKIRDIHESDWDSIQAEFNSSLDDWTYEFTNWFDRNVLKIKRLL